MRNKTAENNGIATDMFDPNIKQVVFVPSGRNSTFTDPSYQLPKYVEQSNRVLTFLASKGLDSYPNRYSLEGKALSDDHSTGLVAISAVAALAANPKGKPFVQALWDAKIPTGKWRYYDRMLYMLALLHVSENFRAYSPGGLPE